MTDSVFDADDHVQLDSYQRMCDVLAELQTRDPAKYSGQISVFSEAEIVNDETVVHARCTLELNAADTPTVDVDSATIGDHIVVPYGRLIRVSDAEYQAAQAAKASQGAS